MKKLDKVVVLLALIIGLSGCALIGNRPVVVTSVCPEYPVPSVEVVEILGPISNQEPAVKAWFNDLFTLQRQLKQCQPD